MFQSKTDNLIKSSGGSQSKNILDGYKRQAGTPNEMDMSNEMMNITPDNVGKLIELTRPKIGSSVEEIKNAKIFHDQLRKNIKPSQGVVESTSRLTQDQLRKIPRHLARLDVPKGQYKEWRKLYDEGRGIDTDYLELQKLKLQVKMSGASKLDTVRKSAMVKDVIQSLPGQKPMDRLLGSMGSKGKSAEQIKKLNEQILMYQKVADSLQTEKLPITADGGGMGNLGFFTIEKDTVTSSLSKLTTPEEVRSFLMTKIKEKAPNRRDRYAEARRRGELTFIEEVRAKKPGTLPISSGKMKQIADTKAKIPTDLSPEQLTLKKLKDKFDGVVGLKDGGPISRFNNGGKLSLWDKIVDGKQFDVTKRWDPKKLPKGTGKFDKGITENSENNDSESLSDKFKKGISKVYDRIFKGPSLQDGIDNAWGLEKKAEGGLIPRFEDGMEKSFWEKTKDTIGFWKDRFKGTRDKIAINQSASAKLDNAKETGEEAFSDKLVGILRGDKRKELEEALKLNTGGLIPRFKDGTDDLSWAEKHATTIDMAKEMGKGPKSLAVSTRVNDVNPNKVYNEMFRSTKYASKMASSNVPIDESMFSFLPTNFSMSNLFEDSDPLGVDKIIASWSQANKGPSSLENSMQDLISTFSNDGGSMPVMHHGGFINKTGPIFAKKGEYIIPEFEMGGEVKPISNITEQYSTPKRTDNDVGNKSLQNGSISLDASKAIAELQKVVLKVDTRNKLKVDTTEKIEVNTEGKSIEVNTEGKFIEVNPESLENITLNVDSAAETLSASIIAALNTEVKVTVENNSVGGSAGAAEFNQLAETVAIVNDRLNILTTTYTDDITFLEGKITEASEKEVDLSSFDSKLTVMTDTISYIKEGHTIDIDNLTSSIDRVQFDANEGVRLAQQALNSIKSG